MTTTKRITITMQESEWRVLIAAAFEIRNEPSHE
jgi:hypothetical protein